MPALEPFKKLNRHKNLQKTHFKDLQTDPHPNLLPMSLTAAHFESIYNSNFVSYEDPITSSNSFSEVSKRSFFSANFIKIFPKL